MEEEKKKGSWNKNTNSENRKKKWETKYKMETKEARKIGSMLTVEKTSSSRERKKRLKREREIEINTNEVFIEKR